MSVIDKRVPSTETSTEFGSNGSTDSAPLAGGMVPDSGPGWWRHRVCQSGLVVSGVLAQTVCVFAGGAVAAMIAPRFLGSGAVLALTFAYLAVAFVAALARAVTSRRQGAGWLLWLAVLLGGMAARDHDRTLLEGCAAWFIVSGICIGLVQAGVRWLDVRVVDRLAPARTIAFLGNSLPAAMMLTQLRAAKSGSVRAVGYFDDRLNRPGPLTDLLPCLGTIDDLVGYIHGEEISEVYMALPWSAGPRISQLIERLRFLPLTVRLVPDHVPPALPGRGDGQIQGVVMPTLMVPPFSAAGAIVKRGLDVGLGALLLIPMLPLFLAVALCIRLDSRGPVFFRQVRSGQYGRPFRIFKFRTLHMQQADAAAETLVTSGDRRVTRVGRFLRKYSVDELPQLLNVVLGHMSLVGPRPHAPKAKADGRIYAELMPEYMLRYRVKPGMTGWAQVNGWRGNTDTEEQLRKRVEFDFQYIAGWSPMKDLEIMIRTVPAMLLPPSQNV